MARVSTSEGRESVTTSARNPTEVNTTNTTPTQASFFTDKALPLHVNLTHTPPKLPEDNQPDVPDDPGHIGTLTLVPCTFPTGGYGWKGKRKVNLELLSVQSGEERTQVEAILSVSATVASDKSATTQGAEVVSEADGGAGGYESDNEETGLKV